MDIQTTWNLTGVMLERVRMNSGKKFPRNAEEGLGEIGKE